MVTLPPLEGFVRDWFAALAADDASRAVRGLREYGSLDLAIMGSVMRDLGVTPDMDIIGVDESAAILFYLQGKIARAFESVRTGQLPSVDTRLDMRVYCAMLEWIAERGAWAPPTPEELEAHQAGEQP